MIDPKRVKALRGLRGWTQAQLSDASKVSQPTISRLERGDSKGLYGDTQRAIAAALGTSVAYLLGQTDDPAPTSTPSPRPPTRRPKRTPGTATPSTSPSAGPSTHGGSPSPTSSPRATRSAGPTAAPCRA